MFTVNTKRKQEFFQTIEDGEDKFDISVTFDFIKSEDMDYVSIRDKLSDKKPILVENEKGKIDKKDVSTYNALLFLLRVSLVSCTGIADEEENPIIITGEDGKVNETNQVAVFEAVKAIPELFDKVVLAYTGLSSKNSKAGATPQ